MHSRRTSRRDARSSTFGAPGRFYEGQRPVVAIATVGFAALCAVGLALAGTYTSDETPEGKSEGTDQRMTRFLAALQQSRPFAETVVRTGISGPGLPATLRFAQPGTPPDRRLDFQCTGPGRVRAIAVTISGTRREHTFPDCAHGIASMAIESATVVVLEPSHEHTRILWALAEGAVGRGHKSSTPWVQETAGSATICEVRRLCEPSSASAASLMV
ncbi:hypothetical protein ABZ858_30035 [Streptomyces sp. NPDC047017]|uniref:hypothetical protein n=1 Tax=Streptomyces sp. NPDC047017 TaxID=3155024 RepID=UPI0033F740F4